MPDMTQHLLTVKEVAKVYRASPATIWRRVKSGVIPKPVKIDGSTLWRMRDIEKHIESLAD